VTDMPGTIRKDQDGVTAVKVRHNHWVVIRDNDKQPLRWSDYEVSHWVVVGKIPNATSGEAPETLAPVTLEAAFGGLVDDLARAAREHNLAATITLTPLDD
jgi:hypothetical protein